jgi:hypothetical protein
MNHIIVPSEVHQLNTFETQKMTFKEAFVSLSENPVDGTERLRWIFADRLFKCKQNAHKHEIQLGLERLAKNEILFSRGACVTCFISIDLVLNITFTAFDRNKVDQITACQHWIWMLLRFLQMTMLSLTANMVD